MIGSRLLQRDIRAPQFLRIALIGLAILPTMAACSGANGDATDGAPVIRVGYFPNITHSQALIGMARGDFQGTLGEGAVIEPTIFNAGPSVIEAMFAGQLDLAYIGPNPAINGYVQSQGEALRIIAGATSAGAALVVRPEAGIRRPEDLSGKRIASPQLGNTQDVALRAYLADHDLSPAEQGGTVEVLPTRNPEILDLFRLGEIDGAWVPEPWASRLIIEGGGELFLDERDLWPDGQFTTAMVIASTSFLDEHPDWVRRWLEAHVDLTLWIQENPDEAKTLLNAQIEEITGQALGPEVLDDAWGRMQVTYDPISDSLMASAEAAFRAGFLDQSPDLSGIYSLELLNEILAERGLAPVH